MKELKGTSNTKRPGVLHIIRHTQFLVSAFAFRWPQFKAFGSSQDHGKSLSELRTTIFSLELRMTKNVAHCFVQQAINVLHAGQLLNPALT